MALAKHMTCVLILPHRVFPLPPPSSAAPHRTPPPVPTDKPLTPSLAHIHFTLQMGLPPSPCHRPCVRLIFRTSQTMAEESNALIHQTTEPEKQTPHQTLMDTQSRAPPFICGFNLKGWVKEHERVREREREMIKSSSLHTLITLSSRLLIKREPLSIDDRSFISAGPEQAKCDFHMEINLNRDCLVQHFQENAPPSF